MYQNTSSRDISLSKTLSWILRHGAIKEGFSTTSDGYVLVSEILAYNNLGEKYNIEDIKRVVADNDKQRFNLRINDSGLLEVKANQGHSFTVSNLDLKPLIDCHSVDNVIHGTYLRNWDKIKSTGLCRMNRQHIHFTNSVEKDRVISGIRQNVNILIYINLKKALEAGIQFFISPNGVILSPGDTKGLIRPEYFLKVVDIRTGKSLAF